MKPRPRRSNSISSACSDTSEFQGCASEGSSAMASARSWGSKAPSKDGSAYEDDSLEPSGRHHPGHKPVADVTTTRGLTHLLQCTIAKLKKRGGCPVNSIKQHIKENYGFSLTSATNNKRLNSALKNLQKKGTIVKTKRGFKLVPINEARRRRRRRSRGRRTRRRRRRRRKGRGRRRRKFRRARRKGRGRRRGRKHRRRRRRRRRRKSRRGRRRRRSRKGRGRRRSRKGRRRGRKRRRRGRRHDIGGSNLAFSGGGGSPRPLRGDPSRGGIPHIPSRNASKVQSRATSRLPSRSHSPGFDSHESPPTRSRRSSARASARNSPSPHLMASLDDYDL